MNKEKNRKIFIIALQISLTLLLAVNPLGNQFAVTFKDRIIGNALLNGINATSRITNFYAYVIILIPLITFILTKLLNKLFINTNLKIIKSMELIAVLGIINTAFTFVSIIQKTTTIIYISNYVLLGINISIIVVTLLGKLLKRKFAFSNLKWSFLVAVPLAFFLTLIMHKFNIKVVSEEINYLIAYFASVIIFFIIINLKKVKRIALQKAGTVLLLALILEFVYLELYNILNQYNIILTHKIRTIALIYVVCIIISAIVYLLNKNKNKIFRYQKYYYPIIIVIFTIIIATNSMVTTVNTDFFESANHGVSIYEFFRYGKIPLLENFDAHMLQNEIYGIIFGYANNDITGAMFNTYSSYQIIFFSIILYFLLKKIFSREVAFYITLFFPFQLDEGIGLYYMAFIAILTLINAYKQRKFKSYLLYYLSLMFICIWSLDTGFSISVATVLVLIYLLFKDRKNIKLKNVIIPFLLVITLSFTIYFLMCTVKNINPISRMIEFLKIAMSTENWSYSELGDVNKFSYIFIYYIMPSIIVFTLIYGVCKQKIDIKMKIILMSLGLFYIFNLQRGLGRHSLEENTIRTLISFSSIYIAILISNRYNKNSIVFIFTYLSIILISQLTLEPNISKCNNIFEASVGKYVSFKLQDEKYYAKVKRVNLAPIMENEYKDLKTVIETLLNENETYLDFTNQTLLYSLLDKEKPVYVDQSPGLLSGEVTQKMFIKEIEESLKDVPITLKAKNKKFAEDLDNVPNNYRYYLISEYIFENYVPMISVNNYEIWVRKDAYNEKLEKSKNMLNDNIQLLDKDTYAKQNIEQYNIKYIPYVWGEYDKKSKDVEILMNLADNIKIDREAEIVDIDSSKINKTLGNYIILQINSANSTTGKVEIYGEEEQVGEYNFNILQGNNIYILRISTMYAWHEANINSISFNSDAEVDLVNMALSNAN